jgi:hypothetical protein
MQCSKRVSTSMVGTLLALAGIWAYTLQAAVAAAAGEPVVTGVWQHHHVNFSYYGITALYSCDGLESNIRSILLHLGARKDAKVRANGCPNGPSVPGRNAIIDADFYTLAPSSEPAPSSEGADAVQAQWLPVEVSSTRPYFMGHGDCELIEEMKDLISKNFSLRDLKYRTDCVPHEVNIDDFSVKAQVLKALPAPVAATKR